MSLKLCSLKLKFISVLMELLVLSGDECNFVVLDIVAQVHFSWFYFRIT